MSLEGDWDKLRKTISALGYVGQGKLLGPLTDVAEEGVQEQYHEDFRGQRDPWGNRWAPNKDGSSPVLFKTGALAGADISSTKGTVRLKPPYYWVFLQQGPYSAPERGVVPFGVSLWNPPIQKELEKVIFGHFTTDD